MRLSIALHALVLALVAVVYAPYTHAAPVDVVAVANGVFDQLLAISLVGAAALLLAGGIAALRYVRDVMGGGAVIDTSRDVAPHVRGYVDQQSYLDALASRLAAEDELNGVEWRDVGTGKSNLDYEAEARADLNAGTAYAGDLSPTYREATLEESASWDRVNEAHDAAESPQFDSSDMGTWSYGHHAAYQAGLTEVRDSEGEESWTSEQWMAFDEGRDAHHRAYLASVGDDRTDAQRTADKEDRKGMDMQAMRDD